MSWKLTSVQRLVPQAVFWPSVEVGDRVLVTADGMFPSSFAVVIRKRGLCLRVKTDEGKEFSVRRTKVRPAR